MPTIAMPITMIMRMALSRVPRGKMMATVFVPMSQRRATPSCWSLAAATVPIS